MKNAIREWWWKRQSARWERKYRDRQMYMLNARFVMNFYRGKLGLPSIV